jgi:small subunit ribosomal protein S11
MVTVAKGASRPRKRHKQAVSSGIVHISASFNNTLIAITDCQGNVLVNASAGTSGFKGSRKGMPFAAQVTAERIGTRARDEFGMKTIVIHVKGPGSGRDAALRALGTLGFQVLYIWDKTGLPHNGCRARKRRRV